MFKSLIAFCLSRRAIVVFGLLLFAGAGVVAFQKLNIEAYPNPTPVILEITAQAPGLSAEEMERYYTRPIEIGLYTTPGIDIIRSTSFYGLSFVRVVFRYGVDFSFAYAQAAVALQQNVSLAQAPYMQLDPASKQTFAQAFDNVATALRAGGNADCLGKNGFHIGRNVRPHGVDQGVVHDAVLVARLPGDDVAEARFPDFAVKRGCPQRRLGQPGPAQ